MLRPISFAADDELGSLRGCAAFGSLGAVVARAMTLRPASTSAAPHSGQKRPVSSVFVAHAVQTLTEIQRSRVALVQAVGENRIRYRNDCRATMKKLCALVGVSALLAPTAAAAGGM